VDILAVLVILYTSYLVARVIIRAEQARPSLPRFPLPVGADSSGATTGFGSRPGPVWGALDDLQLTRLLTNSRPRTINE
jgi:hypothetical protein